MILCNRARLKDNNLQNSFNDVKPILNIISYLINHKMLIDRTRNDHANEQIEQ